MKIFEGEIAVVKLHYLKLGIFFRIYIVRIGDIKGNIHCTCTCTSYIKNVQLLYKFIVLLMVLFGDFKA